MKTKDERGPEYAEGLTSGKDKLMSNLSVGVTRFKKSEIRKIGEGFGGYLPKPLNIDGIQSCDQTKATGYSKKKPFAIQMSNQYPRDLAMYQTTDYLKNV